MIYLVSAELRPLYCDIIIIITIHHESDLNRPVSDLSNILFKALPSRPRPFFNNSALLFASCCCSFLLDKS